MPDAWLISLRILGSPGRGLVIERVARALEVAFAAEKYAWAPAEPHGVAPDEPEERRCLLALLLANVGLVEAVKLAGEKHWREALGRVYG